MLCAMLLALAFQAAARAADAGLEPYGNWYRPHTHTAYAYFKNTGSAPLTVNDLQIDGRPESATIWPMDPNRQSHWFDFVPATVQPGAVVQVRVNLRNDPSSGHVKLSVGTAEGQTASADVASAEPKLFFSDIGFSKDGSSVSLFIAGDGATIDHVLVDGVDATAQSDLSAARAFHGTALVTLRPQTKLTSGSYHIYEVHATDGRRAMYAARTILNDFVIASYGNVDQFQAYKDNGLNGYVSFRPLTPKQIDELARLNLKAAPVPFVGGHYDFKTKQYVDYDEAKSRENLESMSHNDSIFAYSSPDEPDGNDAAVKDLGAHGRLMVHMRQMAEQIDPKTPSFVQIDNSLKPNNYEVYAETMDYSATHRYNLGTDEFLSGDRIACEELRKSSQPQPYLWVTQFYPLRERAGERNVYSGRFPLSGEMHTQMLESLANGAKGVVHYIHSGSTGGRGGAGSDKALWASMKPMHEQLAAIGPVVVHSTPTDWASCSNSNVRTVALLADRSNLVTVVTNQAIKSTKTDYEVPPQKDFTVTVAVPDWMQIASAVEVTPGGALKPIEIKKNKNQIEFSIPQIETGTIVWLRGE